MSFASLPPWLLPALIIHVAMVAVLLFPTWRAFARAGIGGTWSLVLVLPGLGLIVVAVLLAAPVLRRAGWSSVWAILAIIPLVNVVFLWLFAYARWTRTRTEPVDEPQTARRAEPRISAASARVAAPPAEPTLSRPTDDGYEGVDPHNRGLAEEIDTPPAVGEIELGERTMIAGAAAPKAPADTPKPEAPKLDTPKLDTPKPDTPKPEAAEPDAPEPKPLKPGRTKPETREPETPKPEAPEPEAPDAEAPAEPAKAEEPADKSADTPAEAPEPAKAPVADEMTLAAGVLADLDAAEAAPVEPAPPVARAPGDEERTVPIHKASAADGPRVWTLRGVNARSANIEVTIREEDLSQSDTGILVGRSNRVDFIIGDESVSRDHARFVYHDGELCVEDLDSMNGTWVDGAQLDSNAPVPVADQSEVEFGKIKLLVTETAE